MTSVSSSSSKKASPSSSGDDLSPQALFYMSILALQFGLQPLLTKRFTAESVCRSSVILVQEVIKFILASSMLISSGKYKNAVSEWSIDSWIRVAGIPAALYALQNLAALLAYQNLDALTFNVLNQTKTLSAALCCYLVIGRRQSKMQILSLFLLLASALIIEKIVTLDTLSQLLTSSSSSAQQSYDDSDKLSITQLFYSLISGTTNSNEHASTHTRHLTHGVAPVLFASFLSGLAGALSQKNLQGSGARNSYLFSMELCAGSSLFLLLSLLTSHDGTLIRQFGFFHNWNLPTLIPIITNAAGGIIVGLVTKHAGSVRKGFALIFGILLSGLLQQAGMGGVSKEQMVGGLLAAVSLWTHALHPYTAKTNSTTTATKNGHVTAAKVLPKSRKARKED